MRARKISEQAILISVYRENVFLPFPRLLCRMKIAMLFSIKQMTKRTTRTARLIERTKVVGSNVGSSIVIDIKLGMVGNGGNVKSGMVARGIRGNVVGELIGEVLREENPKVVVAV